MSHNWRLALKKQIQSLLSAESCFWLTALITRIVLGLYVMYAAVGLMPDEAQYWTWSRSLDIGYYSKPPGIAWQIALSTSVFPYLSEFSVRFISFALLPVISAYLLSRSILLLVDDKWSAALTGIVYLVSPVGFFGTIFATTDSMMLVSVFGAISSYISCKIKGDASFRSAARIACWLSWGAVWKWTIYLALPLVIFDRDILLGSCDEKSLKRFFRLFFLSFLLVLGLTPSLIWNISHNWVTFRHVEASLINYEGGNFSSNPAEFFLASTALVSWGFLLIGVVFGSRHIRNWLRIKTVFHGFVIRLIFTILSLWGGLCIYSFFSRVQGNWAILANGMFFILVGLGLYEMKERHARYAVWIIGACVFSIASQVFTFSLHLLPYQWALRMTPLKQGLGVKEAVEKGLSRLGSSSEAMLRKKQFLFSDRYQNVAQIEFYDPCRSHEVYFFNIHGLRLNHYSFRAINCQRYIGATGLFFSIIPFRECDMLSMRIEQFKKKLSPYFREIEYVGMEPLISPSGIPVRALLLFECRGYNGDAPRTMDRVLY